MTDAELIKWLRDNLEWDGYGYWLPEICVASSDGSVWGEIKKPSVDEFRSLLSGIASGDKT